MKKALVFLLIAAMLLPGCAAQAPKTQPTASTPAKKAEINKVYDAQDTIPDATEAAPEAEEPVAEEAPSADVQEKAEAPEKEEAPNPKKEEAAPKTEPSEKEEVPAQPSAPTEKPQQTPAQQETQKPTQQETQKPAPSVPSKPAYVGPTSSATCKDTGSSAIWDDPDADQKFAYEENDPQRTAYLEYLQTEGNEYYFWMQTENTIMYLGRNYGLPLYTSYDIFTGCAWSSSDESVLTVNRVGFVVPQKAGTATVTASYTDPETQEINTRQCRVTVKEYPRFTIAQLEKRAHEEAQKIANYALNYAGANTDLERIAVAAALVHEYVKKSGPANVNKFVDGEIVYYPITGYNQPFGTLVTFHSSCAGDTRAMGLVLEYMGFQWYHTNANQWDHQWCVVYNVDGQTAFADASAYGMVGYGQRASDGSNGLVFRNGGLVSARS